MAEPDTLAGPSESRRGFSRWLAAALDLVFPPACAHCRASLDEGSGLLVCDECREALVDLRPACPRCGALAGGALDAAGCPRCRGVRFAFESVTRLGTYEGPLRAAVLRLKRERNPGLAIALGDLLATTLAAPLADWRPDAVAAVPMHWTRRVWRGVNSPEKIAERLAAHLNLPLASHLLVRQRRTQPQAPLSPGKRRANVRRAFRARPHRDLPGARLLLVDDVMTTGATVHEAARTLVRAGAGPIRVVVLARAEGLA